MGALIVGEKVPLAAFIRGGGQEMNRRAGTENVPGIIGFGVAARLAVDDLREMPRIAKWRDALQSQLLAVANDDAVVIGANAPRVANTLSIAMRGVSGETQVVAMDLAGVAVSAGAACSSGKVKASHVLRAMGYGDDIAASVQRIALVGTRMKKISANVPRHGRAFIAAPAVIHNHKQLNRKEQREMSNVIGMNEFAAMPNGNTNCWLCQKAASTRALFCHHCGTVQPVRDIDHFSRLGVERRIDVDVEHLDRQYAALSRTLDPQRFLIRGLGERGYASKQLEALTAAYETLREPLKRGRYWLSLHESEAQKAVEANPMVQELRGELDKAAEPAACDRVRNARGRRWSWAS